MYNKIVVLMAALSCSAARFVQLYPEHESIAYNHETPIYEVPVENVYGYGHGYDGEYQDSYPKYKFAYGVDDPHTGDHKSQAEERDGDVVKGYYTVADPDGTLRTVHYTADDHNGFNAVVEKQGVSVHPVAVPVVEKVIVEPVVYEKEVGPVYGGYGYGHGHGYGHGYGHGDGGYY